VGACYAGGLAGTVSAGISGGRTGTGAFASFGAAGVAAGAEYLDSPGSETGFISKAGCIDLLGVGFEITISSVETSDGFTVSLATGPSGREGAAAAAGSSFFFGGSSSFFSSFGSSVLLTLANLVILR
jgi:hypothetical protein